jgi:hypothetical protein
MISFQLAPGEGLSQLGDFVMNVLWRHVKIGTQRVFLEFRGSAAKDFELHVARCFGGIDMWFARIQFVCDRWTFSNSHYGIQFVS